MSERRTDQVRTDARTLYEATGDTAYAIRYMQLQERLFNRMGNVLKFTSLFGGSAAFAGAATNSPTLTAMSGVIVAISTILDFVIKPDEKSFQCRGARHRYQRLLQKASSHSIAEHDRLVDHDRKAAKIGRMDTPNIEGLRKPAYNDSSIERGRPDYTWQLSCWERFLKWLV